MSELRYPSRRVCVVLLTALGDVVYGLPVVNALKRDDPSRRITWVVEPLAAPLLAHQPGIDEVVVYEKSRGVKGVLDLRRKLAGKRFDLTLNLNLFFKSVWPTLLSRAPHRLGFDRGRAFDQTWLVSNHHLEPRPRDHMQEMFLQFLDHLRVPDYQVEWTYPLTEDERRTQAEFFAPLDDRPVVALVPASKQRSKDWLADRWARVADALAHDFGFRTVLVGGPGQRETAIAREIVERASASPAWGMGDGVRRLIWLLGGSDLVIAPDTGPLHLARCLGVPAIGLYGRTNPYRGGPWRAYHDLWVDAYTDPGEAPDPSRYPPKTGRMERITVNDVLERVQRAVDRYGAGRRRPAPAPGILVEPRHLP
jgi:heptosyltransferase I